VVQASLAAAPGPTVTASGVALSIVLSLTVIEAGPAVTRVIAPFLPLETVATPLVKVIAVAEPKLTTVPAEFTTVACAR
jgi:hypothetical protein